MWHASQGPAADAQGNVYAITANGGYHQGHKNDIVDFNGTTDFAEAIVRIKYQRTGPGQGALTLDREHDLLYATNSGSDTVTVFRVRGDRLTRLQTIGSGGGFPVSVAVHDDLVYVLNAREGGTVQGFRLLGSRLIRIPSWNRRLGLDPAATPEFTHTPG